MHCWWEWKLAQCPWKSIWQSICSNTTFILWPSNPSSGNLTYRYICRCVKWHMFKFIHCGFICVGLETILKSLSTWALWNELWYSGTPCNWKRTMKLFMRWHGKMSSETDHYLKKAKCKAVHITCICIFLYSYRETQVEDTSYLWYPGGRSRQVEDRCGNQGFTAYLFIWIDLWALWTYYLFKIWIKNSSIVCLYLKS